MSDSAFVELSEFLSDPRNRKNFPLLANQFDSTRSKKFSEVFMRFFRNQTKVFYLSFFQTLFESCEAETEEYIGRSIEFLVDEVKQELKGEEVLEFLFRNVRHKNERVRALVTFGLLQAKKTERVMQALEILAQDESTFVRIWFLFHSSLITATRKSSSES